MNPRTSLYDRFATSSSDLSSFFRSLASQSQPRPTNFNPLPPSYSTQSPSHTSTHLELFDSGLKGKEGAVRVLQALERAPGTRSITLSNNGLGDDGCRELCVGLKRARSHGIGGSLVELNLSGNKLSDVSLHLITLHLLTSSPHPPTLTHLYLTANNLTLSPPLPSYLSTSLASPLSQLTCLSLTNNPNLGPSLSTFLPLLTLSPNSNLSQLHFSLCGLTPKEAPVIAHWLKDPEGGGTRLQAFCANGNWLDERGLRLIAKSVVDGYCTGVILLEFLACEDPPEDLEEGEFEEVFERIEKELEGDEQEGWRERLKEALKRNEKVLRETREAALGLLSPARVLFGGNPREKEVDVGELRRVIEGMGNTDSSSFESTPLEPTFPFLRLPIELQIHVLRHLLPSSLSASSYPPRSSSSSTPFQPPQHPIPRSPLTESQFLSLLSHAASQQTLTTEVEIVRIGKMPMEGSVLPSLDGRKRTGVAEVVGGARMGGNVGGRMEVGKWEEWVLRSTGCDRFMRA
ncbi:hypothetical protein P7C70_g2882, partial [Phenoliferia sp. Uapishka_3]